MGKGIARANDCDDIEVEIETDLSGPTRFMQRVQKLCKDDPIKGQYVLRLIADRLRRGAKGKSLRARRALELADRLQYVANTGDLTALTPRRSAAVSRNMRIIANIQKP